MNNGAYSREELLLAEAGQLFGADRTRLPLPPMLMLDRITSITVDSGSHGPGQVVAELDFNPDLWSFKCHFESDPVRSACSPRPTRSRGLRIRRVVVTGPGIVASIATGRQQALDALRAGHSGIRLSEDHRDMGFRRQVHGPIDLPLDTLIDRKLKRFMSGGAPCNYLALREAIGDADLADELVSSPGTGLIVGSGGTNASLVFERLDG